METKKDVCTKYDLAITDYVLGEEMDITEAQLAKHLKTCKKCRADLADWQDSVALLRAEAYAQKPKTKERFKALMKKIHSGPMPPQTAVITPQGGAISTA